jgi:hypothetical protein
VRKHFELGALCFFTMRFFLQNTTAQWFYRATDDIIVNFALFPIWLRSIASRYRPLCDRAIIGNCLHGDDHGGGFLQGGSGFMISRGSLPILLEIQPVFFARLANNSAPIAEDVLLPRLMVEAANLTFFEATSPYITGNRIHYPHEAILLSGNIHRLPACPALSDIPTEGCRPHLTSVKDIVVFHNDGGYSPDRIAAIWNRLQSMPNNLMFWIKGMWPQLCLLSGIEIPAREF